MTPVQPPLMQLSKGLSRGHLKLFIHHQNPCRNHYPHSFPHSPPVPLYHDVVGRGAGNDAGMATSAPVLPVFFQVCRRRGNTLRGISPITFPITRGGPLGKIPRTLSVP